MNTEIFNFPFPHRIHSSFPETKAISYFLINRFSYVLAVEPNSLSFFAPRFMAA